MPTSRFWFSSAGVPHVEASVVAVGSTSTITETWLWAWANPHLSDVPSPETEKVRADGLAWGFEFLTTEKWAAHEVDGWEMTAVAGLVLGAEAGCRCPDERGALFVLLSDLRRIRA